MSPVTEDAVVGATTARQVVFVGPMGVGKTTAVTALSDVPVVGTDVRQSTPSCTEAPQDGKTTTTVGIDDGEWPDPAGRRVALLGTPGQVRFASARESVTAHRARIVLWVFGQRPDAAFQIGRWLELLGDESVWARTVVALTRLQGPHPERAVDVARSALDPRFQHVPLLAADPEIRSAMLCTADGMNLCSLGVPQADDVGRLAALNSSMYAIASSQAEIVAEGAASPQQTMVSLSTGRGHVVLASFVQPPLGQLLLSVSADAAQLGFLVGRAREAAVGIQEWLTKEQAKGGTPA